MTKPSEMVKAHSVIDDGREASADRRRFMKEVGVAVLTVQFLPLLAHASGNAPSDGNETADNLIIHSSPGFVPHVHDLLIPYAVLKAPPGQGLELETTRALFHRHKVMLTREQLIIVNQGGTVTQKASSHLFAIALAKREGHSQAEVGKEHEIARS